MKNKIDIILQALLGLAFLVFGLNKFLNFLPAPELPEAASDFFGALAQTGYFIPLLAGTEVIVGALLLLRLFSPLALIILMPISINIVLFHIFLAPEGGIVGYVLAALNVYLLFAYFSKCKPLLSPK